MQIQEEERCFYQSVLSQWVDYNGHMNDSAYALIFTKALEHFLETLGLDEKARKHHHYTTYTLETHTCFLKEALEADIVQVKTQVLDWDAKRIHLFMEMINREKEIIATNEYMVMGMDQKEKRPAPFPPKVAEALASLGQQHQKLPRPEKAGRRIGIPTKNKPAS
ncbi:thioesterase family protein [Tindallia californiensis]|uniref:Acyl-CoA thioester hydrolase n=1 Tax=Tindallia californiensis TaxID=159292 RepID=A0A1H3PVQ3_9FIRM|nr:thioesterase family protein [Tindallia californiensis]SDZ05043.1 acyl-CoA thioester hydrolase [Tindallia californiensis]